MTPVDSDEEDLTRKERREQARAQRKEAEAEAASQTVRRKRMIQLGVGVAVVAVAIVIIAVAAGGGGSKTPPKKGSPQEQAAVNTVNATLAGTTQSGVTLGSPTAPVTLVYFGDLQCPICRDFTLGALPPIIKKWVVSGKLRIEYRSLQTATHDPETFKSQQIAALAAGAQNKMWNYLELFYHQQGEENTEYVTEAFLENLARQAQVDQAKWKTDRQNPSYENQVATDQQLANTNGFNGTPSFLIGRSGGALKKFEYSSLTDPTAFNEAIEAQLKA
jgi:protein-disulfide isomerase